MAYTAADRMMAVRHVEDGVRRITALRDSIALRRRDGHPTVLAEKALLTMLQTLEQAERRLIHEGCIPHAHAQTRAQTDFVLYEIRTRGRQSKSHTGGKNRKMKIP